jgi:hypothetical protein
MSPRARMLDQETTMVLRCVFERVSMVCCGLVERRGYGRSTDSQGWSLRINAVQMHRCSDDIQFDTKGSVMVGYFLNLTLYHIGN